MEIKYGREIVEATVRAMALNEHQLPPPEPRKASAARARGDQAYEAICEFCRQRSVAPTLVASPREVARACALSSAQHDGHRLFRSWRGELLAELLPGLMAKKAD